jgi:hypothetical protein
LRINAISSGVGRYEIIAKATSTFIEKDRVATDEHWQLGDIRRNPSRLIVGEQLDSRAVR